MDFAILPDIPSMPSQGTGIATILERARRAEELGYTACFLPDHYIFEELGALRPERPTYDAFMTLALIAQQTRSMKLVTHVACMLFRHPVMHARLFAQIDEASGGRMIAGVGAGWTQVEFERLRIPFPPVSERLRMMDESVEIMRGLWSRDSFSFDGEFYQLTDVPCVPKPTRPGGPPIMLGGSGNGILRRAGRYADIVHMVPQTGPHGTTKPEEIRQLDDDAVAAKLAIVRDEEARAGRAPGSVAFSTTIFTLIFTDSPQATTGMAEAVGGMFGIDADTARRLPIALIGTPAEMIDELQRRREVHGLSLLGINPASDADLERFGREVLPALV
jgi:probable F420-dependent oxidoreductase